MDILNALQYLNSTTLSVIFLIGGFIYFFVIKPRHQSELATSKSLTDKFCTIPTKDEINLMIESVISKIEKPNYDLVFLKLKDIIQDNNVEMFKKLDGYFKTMTTEYHIYLDEIKIIYPKVFSKLEDIEKIIVNIQTFIDTLSENMNNNQDISDADKRLEIVALNDLISLTNTIENLLEFLILEMSKKKIIDELDFNKMTDIKNKIQSNRTSATTIIDILLNNTLVGRNGSSKLNKVINR